MDLIALTAAITSPGPTLMAIDPWCFLHSSQHLESLKMSTGELDGRQGSRAAESLTGPFTERAPLRSPGPLTGRG